ncbi:hypothetical protein CLI92_10195 [Vandammella animalimorsus]|uniref:DUF600 domain-containing protein n=1 Tax=Vandammella animalimorsus TaxID=2029117 RepID=A0A2A2T4Q3_9BURK|nr:hypothetical protein [Vandammella animalimorsus]PAT31612.1 hypothetical protein CK626_08900 [Vandammella animalimorsus]PAX16171.1 hypothetical protein CLI92_10195 [Vandammella animalimorsus]PAX18201.1 hypothetical protein CLI93_11725 [Vandammella animalimorsus]
MGHFDELLPQAGDLLTQVLRSALQEIQLPPQWSKLILIGEYDGCGGMGGFAFDAQGKAHAVAPRGGHTLELLEQLAQAMAQDSPTGSPWLACLLRLGSDGRFGAQFEYEDSQRWAITPANRAQRVAEFAAMPV